MWPAHRGARWPWCGQGYQWGRPL